MENTITLYTVAEVSKILRVGKNKVYDYINAGLIHAIKVGGLKISSRALEQFVQDYQDYDVDDPYNIKTLG